MIPHRTVQLACVLLLAAVAFVGDGCSGPQPLDVAIAPRDRADYAAAASAHPASPRDAFVAWKSQATGRTIDELRAADASLSERDNPFDARKDPDAVSRGAVLYAVHCAACHGDSVDGRGPQMKQPLKAMDFHAFAKRFAVTVHRGAPTKWYRSIRDGVVSESVNADGSPIAMPPFGETFAREQIWLTITYLQSLDADATRRREEATP